MRYRDAKKLRVGDVITDTATQILHKVVSIEIFVEAKQVRIYAETIDPSKNPGSIFYNTEVE